MLSYKNFLFHVLANIPKWELTKLFHLLQLTFTNYNAQVSVPLAKHTFDLYQTNTQYTAVPGNNSRAN